MGITHRSIWMSLATRGNHAAGAGITHASALVARPGLLLDEDLLEHREPAAAELARHVDRLQTELANSLRSALQDSRREERRR